MIYYRYRKKIHNEQHLILEPFHRQLGLSILFQNPYITLKRSILILYTHLQMLPSLSNHTSLTLLQYCIISLTNSFFSNENVTKIWFTQYTSLTSMEYVLVIIIWWVLLISCDLLINLTSLFQYTHLGLISWYRKEHRTSC